MADACDDQKALDALLDPVTSGLVSSLEGGSRTLAQLCESSGLSAADITERLSYLSEHGLLDRTGEGDTVTYAVNAKKIDAVLSRSGHFDGAIDMVTQMDSFLN